MFEGIRRSAHAVHDRGRFVRIDDAALVDLSYELETATVAPTPPDPARRRRDSPRATLAFLFTLNAVNFGSGWFPFLRKRPGCSGYFTIATHLSERFDERGAYSASELVAMRVDECAALFGQDLSVPEAAELMSLFAQSLSDLGAWLEGRFAGCFEAIVEEAGRSAEGLVALLREMPLYRDVSRYAELEVPFFKRAQLAVSDLASTFAGEGFGSFRDLDDLTLFADNLVPHVLRHEGVLVYDPTLAEQIAAELPLRAGSPEEVEIRAVAVHAVEKLVEAIRDRGGRSSAQQIDTLLWTRGHSREMKSRPRHRARTVYY